MQLEFAYLPKSYYLSLPNPGGYFPFVFNTDYTPYVMEFMDIQHGFHHGSNYILIAEWVSNLDGFPIHMCAELTPTWKEDFMKLCVAHHLDYELLNSDYAVLRIEDKGKLNKVLPLLLNMANCGELVIWSSSMDNQPFTIEQKEWKDQKNSCYHDTVIVNMQKAKTIFWPGYDGDFISVVSNDPRFHCIEEVRKRMPDIIELIQIELGE